MRYSQHRPLTSGLLSAAAIALLALQPVAAFPFFRQTNAAAGYAALMPRQCPQWCGWQNQLCCGTGTDCQTVNNQATCSPQAGAGVYTTTWTETRTYTSTVTPVQPQAATTAVSGPGGPDCIPQNPGEQSCGWVCCAAWQYCAYKGQCLALNGVSASPPPAGVTQTVVITSNGVVTTQFSAPYRVTSATITGVFTSGAAFTTGAITTSTLVPVPVTGGGGGLSAGAIAGIVIGVLAAIALLILLCFCCIARGLWNAIFGRKKRREEEIEVIDERYSRRGSRPASASAASRRTRHSGWFGASERDRRSEKRKSSSGAGWLGLAAGAATLLALLNLKKDKKRPPPRKARSSYSDSYFSETISSRSSPSSGPSRVDSRVDSRRSGAHQSRHTSRVSRSTRR